MQWRFEAIEVLLFDFGNVIVDLEYERSYRALVKLAPDLDITELNKKIVELESGKISPENWINFILRHSLKGVQARDVVVGYNTMLIDLPLHRLEYLKALKDKYTLALLSNTSQVHMSWINKHLKKKNSTGALEEVFDYILLSHHMGLVKPDPDLPDEVEKILDVAPHKILFVDDKLENIWMGMKAGWFTVHYDPEWELVNVFPDFLMNLQVNDT